LPHSQCVAASLRVGLGLSQRVAASLRVGLGLPCLVRRTPTPGALSIMSKAILPCSRSERQQYVQIAETDTNRITLLSPAGDWDCLRAAAANGANAVYFGLPLFNARHRAANFTLDDLPRVMRFLHARNVKGYITLNTLIFSAELPRLVEYVQAIAAAGADAVIVQDLGLVKLIKRVVPGLPVHASTQMTLAEPRGIAFAKRLGVELIVLARELSIEEIRKVTAAAEVPVEVFVHGALCVAYSGQCLTSEALGGRSANRGQCAQACRLPYEMFVDGKKRELGDRAYLLSPQDLAAYDRMDELIAAGVSSFKIEGRLKSASYVAAATQSYRAAIDAAVARRTFALSRREERELAQTFSRGFTPGFLEGPNHQRLVEGRIPKSRGIRLGSVLHCTRRGVVVRLFENAPAAELINAGDGVVLDLGKPEENEPGGRVWKVQTLGGESVVELLFEPDSLNFSAIPAGCTVWKTDDPALRKRLEQSYTTDPIARRVSISFQVSGAIGSALTLRVRDDEGREAIAVWPGPLAAARQHPLRLEFLREQLDRLGDTPFSLGDVTMNVPDAVMVPKSVLNDLRRQAVAELVAMRESRTQYAIAEADPLAHIRGEIVRSASQLPGKIERGQSRLTVLVRTLEQLEAVLAWRPAPGLTTVEMIWCDFEDTRRYREAVPRARATNMPIGLATLRIFKPGEEGFLKPILNAQPDAVLVRNLGSLDFFRSELPEALLVGDFSLNVANEITADLLMREGLARLVPSFDLNWEQLADLVRRSHPEWYEPVIHQHMPMFHNEFCTFAAFLSKGKDHRDCGRPCDRHRIDLRDRAGASFPVVADAGCRNTVYNSIPQSGAEYIGRMQQLGLHRFRVDLLRETADQVEPLLSQYARVIAGLDDGRETWRKLRAMNQLGVTRGTLQLI
jgi:U32 family peptidase